MQKKIDKLSQKIDTQSQKIGELKQDIGKLNVEVASLTMLIRLNADVYDSTKISLILCELTKTLDYLGAVHFSFVRGEIVWPAHKKPQCMFVFEISENSYICTKIWNPQKVVYSVFLQLLLVSVCYNEVLEDLQEDKQQFRGDFDAISKLYDSRWQHYLRQGDDAAHQLKMDVDWKAYDKFKEKMQDLTELAQAIVKLNKPLKWSMDQLCGLSEPTSSNDNRKELEQLMEEGKLSKEFSVLANERFKGLSAKKQSKSTKINAIILAEFCVSADSITHS